MATRCKTAGLSGDAISGASPAQKATKRRPAAQRTGAFSVSERRPFGDALPFVVDTVTPRGRWLGRRCFDVPTESYSQGRVTGAKVAAQLLAYMRDGKLSPMVWHELMVEVADACRLPMTGVDSRGGAGVAFMAAMLDMVTFAAKHCDVDAYAAGLVKREADNAARWEALQRSEALAFAARMSEAKARKRQAAARSHEVVTIGGRA